MEEQKPISETLYRIISTTLFIALIFATAICVYGNLPPYSFIRSKLGYSDDMDVLVVLCTFLVLMIPFIIFMLILRPFSNIPKHPYSNLTFGSFIKGDNDQDEYKAKK